MYRWLTVALLPFLLTTGCAPSSLDESALKPGDVIHLRVSAPKEWVAGDKAIATMSFEVHRPGRDETPLLTERYIPHQDVQMLARVTFFNDDGPLGEPLDVPFERDC